MAIDAGYTQEANVSRIPTARPLERRAPVPEPCHSLQIWRMPTGALMRTTRSLVQPASARQHSSSTTRCPPNNLQPAAVALEVAVAVAVDAAASDHHSAGRAMSRRGRRKYVRAACLAHLQRRRPALSTIDRSRRSLRRCTWCPERSIR